MWLPTAGAEKKACQEAALAGRAHQALLDDVMRENENEVFGAEL